MKSVSWNCACIRPLLANLVTFDGEKCVLLLCTWKLTFLRFSYLVVLLYSIWICDRHHTVHTVNTYFTEYSFWLITWRNITVTLMQVLTCNTHAYIWHFWHVLTYWAGEHEVFNLTVQLDVKIDINYTQQYTITIANLVGCMLLSFYTNELQNPKALGQEITQYSSSIKITLFLYAYTHNIVTIHIFMHDHLPW